MLSITKIIFNVKLIQGQIGLNSVHMVMELIRDNRKIVDRISHEHIDKFVGLLQRDKVCSDLTSMFISAITLVIHYKCYVYILNTWFKQCRSIFLCLNL